MQPKHIFVIDHDGDVRDVVSALLIDLGHWVSVAKDAEAMDALLEAGGIDLILLDASTDETPGIHIAREAKERGIRLVMISGNPKLMESFHARADQLLWKPFRREQLEQAVQVALASSTYGQRTEDLA